MAELENYEPLPQDHYLRQVAKELSSVNALALRDLETLEHLAAVLRSAIGWVWERERQRNLPPRIIRLWEADDDHGHD